MKCVVYDVDCFRQQEKYCYWFLYPFYRTAVHIRNAKCWFYRYLNRKGIMKTPRERSMCITDIPFIGNIKKRISGVM